MSRADYLKFNQVNLKTKSYGFCKLIRTNKDSFDLVRGFLRKFPHKNAMLIFSMWDGYLSGGTAENAQMKELWNMFDAEHRIIIHTSGHASAETLAEVCNLVNPAIGIIPIHTEHADEFANLPQLDEALRTKIITKSQIKDGVEIVEE